MNIALACRPLYRSAMNVCVLGPPISAAQQHTPVVPHSLSPRHPRAHFQFPGNFNIHKFVFSAKKEEKELGGYGL